MIYKHLPPFSSIDSALVVPPRCLHRQTRCFSMVKQTPPRPYPLALQEVHRVVDDTTIVLVRAAITTTVILTITITTAPAAVVVVMFYTTSTTTTAIMYSSSMNRRKARERGEGHFRGHRSFIIIQRPNRPLGKGGGGD